MMARVNIYAGAYASLRDALRRARLRGDEEEIAQVQEDLESIERFVVVGQGVRVGHWLYEVTKATKER